jgi:hypothetical protein
MEVPISKCAIISRRIGRSFYWKQMTSVGVINAQHPKNARTIVQIIEGRPNILEKT